VFTPKTSLKKNGMIISCLVLGLAACIAIGAVIPKSSHADASAERPRISAYNPVPCADAWTNESHHEKDRVRYFDVDIPIGCQSGGVYPPDWWRQWERTFTGSPAGCTFYIQYEGDAPQGPYSYPNLLVDGGPTSSRVAHIEGATDACRNAKIRFYTFEPLPPD